MRYNPTCYCQINNTIHDTKVYSTNPSSIFNDKEKEEKMYKYNNNHTAFYVKLVNLHGKQNQPK